MDRNCQGNNRAGFTLIELMISLTIIIMVTAIAIPNFQKAGEKAQASGCEANKKIISAQLENYFMVNKTYPLTDLAGVSDFYIGFDIDESIVEGIPLHKAYHALGDQQSDWHPVDLLKMRDEGYLQEIATCPRGGIYLVKLNSNGNVIDIMCTVMDSNDSDTENATE